MNLAELAIRYKTVTWVLLVVFLIYGAVAFISLGRLEDPVFTIKEAKVVTTYPGATPSEVEQEVTDIIETAIQQLPQLKKIESTSTEGLSILTPEIKDKYDKQTLPQVWDELRRKVNDVQNDLPPGVNTSVVNDDFGDVYGIYFAITGEGFTYAELEDYVDMLRRELLLVPNVSKIELWGIQPRTIFIEISKARMSQLGVSIEEIFSTLQNQNLVTDAGHVEVGQDYITLNTSGSLDAIKDIQNLLIRGSDEGNLIYLDDIADISRGYVTPPKKLMRFNQEASVAIGISASPDANVVKVGEDIRARLDQLKAITPIGMNISDIYYQPAAVQKAVNGFLVSLMQAIAIVIVVLLIFMGMQSGLIIGGVLLMTILCSFVFMQYYQIPLERISLGALIIALGMLVDNAIVVTDGILVKLQAGMDRLQACKDVVAQTAWPLLGATLVGILAFAAISMSQDSTGEYTRSLFQVICISLLLSWVLAVTVTPLLCYDFLYPKVTGEEHAPYQGLIYTGYQALLKLAIKRRVFTLLLMVILLLTSIFCFKYVDQSFFPDSTMPQFMVDIWLPEGTDIRSTSEQIKQVEQYINEFDDVESVATFIGGGASRFTLIYSPEEPFASYAQMLVTVKNFENVKQLMPKIRDYIDQHLLDAEGKVKPFRMGPSQGAQIEARFSGEDPVVLRQLAEQAMAVMQQNPNATNIRTDWRNKVKVIQANYSDARARRTGVTRADVSNALKGTFEGKQVALYRERNKFLPIIYRLPESERDDVSQINNISVWSPVANRSIPIRQVVSSFSTLWRDPILKRRDRKLTITAECDPLVGFSPALHAQIRSGIETIPLPPGYEFEWGGEYEDTNDAQAGLISNIPLVVTAMIVLVIILFNSLRQPLIIWLCVPLAFIGVTFGLLVTRQSFGFMALLGFLSLSGMLIKNAIVLIDQIDLEIREGKNPYTAVIDSALSRFRPVLMAAATTVLGMIPLLPDVFFVSMAVTIMFGLAFATVLTLIVVPVLYTVLFRIPRIN